MLGAHRVPNHMPSARSAVVDPLGPFIGGCEGEARGMSASMDTEQAAPLNQSAEHFACQAKSHALMSNDDS